MSDREDSAPTVLTAKTRDSPIDSAESAAARGWQDAPVGCTGSSEEVAGIIRLLASLAAQAVAPPQRTGSGYALWLPPSKKLQRVASEFIGRDSACCPFLEFDLDREGRALRLQVSGPEDAQTALDLSFELCRVAQSNRPADGSSNPDPRREYR